MCNEAELSASWPNAWSEAWDVPLAKAAGPPGVLEVRPISLLATTARLWSSTRLKLLQPWMEAILPDNTHAFRAGHST
eukprot:154702-Amphidinium_carterae.1